MCRVFEMVSPWPHTDTLVEFEVGDGTVTTTEDHEFWNVTDSAWQETQHIDEGDLLLTSDGMRSVPKCDRPVQ